MITTRGTASRAVLSVAQQMSLSVLGTLAATAVLAELKSEWTARPAGPASTQAASSAPSLTASGKFAARAAGGEPEQFVTLTTLPLILPLFTASAVPRLDASPPEPSFSVANATSSGAPVSDLSKPLRITSHRDTKRIAAGPPLPRRRSPDPVAGTAALPEARELPDAVAGDLSLWTRSKSAYRTVASWSDTLVDHLLP